MMWSPIENLKESIQKNGHMCRSVYILRLLLNEEIGTSTSPAYTMLRKVTLGLCSATHLIDLIYVLVKFRILRINFRVCILSVLKPDSKTAKPGFGIQSIPEIPVLTIPVSFP